MRKLLTLVATSLFLVAGVAATAPAQASASSTSGVVAETPLRYYATYYGPNPWWLCYQRGHQGVSNGEWYDFECRGGTSWVDLYIQVAP